MTDIFNKLGGGEWIFVVKKDSLTLEAKPTNGKENNVRIFA